MFPRRRDICAFFITGDNMCFREFLGEGLVLAVEVVVEVDGAIGVDDGGVVDDEERHGGDEFDDIFIAAVLHGLLNRIIGPCSLVAQEPAG